MKKLTIAVALTIFVATVPAAMAAKRTSTSNAWSASQRAEFEATFARFDRNGDGRITRDEFPLDVTFFDRLDLNRNGVLTRSEIERAIPNRAALEQQVGAYDRNGDGVITRDEFPGDAATFARLDRNRDGVLSSADRGKHVKKH